MSCIDDRHALLYRINPFVMVDITGDQHICTLSERWCDHGFAGARRNCCPDKLLAALRTAGIRIPHKAVLTPTNQNWNVYQLAQELERERQAMEKR